MQVYTASFIFGLLATTSPCVLPLYPGFLAYLSGQSESRQGRGRYFLGLYVLAGVLTMMLLLGAIVALLAIPTGKVLAYLLPIADGLILVLGVLLILDINPFKTLPQIQVPILQRPAMNAYVYGLLYGPIALPCSGRWWSAFLRSLLPLVKPLPGYGPFYGSPWFWPTVVCALASFRRLTAAVDSVFTRHSRLVNLVGGLLLIGVAVYDLIKNWQSLLLFL